jgi:hypothetical protein
LQTSTVTPPSLVSVSSLEQAGHFMKGGFSKCR